MTDINGVPYSDEGASRESAERLAMSGHRADQERSVLRLLVARAPGGAACFEVERALRMLHQSASSCLRALVLRGLAEKSALRRFNPDTGRSVSVWIALPPK